MRRLILLILIALGAWFGWKQYGDRIVKGPEHRAVIENRSDRGMVAVRLVVGGRRFVKDTLADGQDASFPFHVGEDSHFELTWSWSGSPAELTWSGGYVSRGPMAQQHVMTVDGDGNVIYRAEGR